MTGGAHHPYWNPIVQADYCQVDGERWPCDHHRRHRPASCRCSHVRDFHGSDRNGRTLCFSAACGCARYRPNEDKQ